jgi:MFS family permease
MLASMVVCAACFALFPAVDGYGAWLVIRFVFGAAEGFLFVAAETWINQAIDDRVRGRVVAIYTTALALGFATGPLIIAATGIEGPRPFLVGAGLVLAGLLLLLLGLGTAPGIAGVPSHGLLTLLRLIPVAAASAALFGLLDGGLISLLAVYGVAIGLDTAAAAGLVTTLVVGGIVLQLPIGWLADRTDRARTLAGCAAAGTAILLAVPAAVDEPVVMHGLLFVLGGVLGSFWMLAMTALGERFRGPDLAAGNVALTLAYGLGSVAGPAVGGLAMELWSPHGLMATLAAFTAAFAWFALAHARRG